MTRAGHGERGAALLVVMVSVAVLTALAVNLAYDARVSLQIAANARDDLKATALAKSGVAFSRLVLQFQQDMDDSIPTLPPNVPALPRPQLWRIVPVGSALAEGLFGASGGAGSGVAAAAHEGGAAVGPPANGFMAQLDDEGRKVNVQLDAFGVGGLLAAQVQSIWQLICDSRWDDLFDREDANGQRVSRTDLLVYLRDWVDEDEVSSALAASFPGGGCVMIAPQNPFEAGFGDENFPYDRGEDRYRAKNARMDSLDELYLVAGVGDLFVAAFGDSMTVYLPRDTKRNINETDPARLLELAKIIADPPSQPRLYDTTFAEQLHKLVLDRTYGGMLSLSPLDFGQLVETAGVKVNANLIQPTSPQNPFTDRSTVFRVRSQGRAGDVKKTLDVVMRFEKAQQAQVVAIPGRIVHWREE